MDSSHIEHDLFLLMIQLSQIQDPELIRRMFMESVNTLDPELKIEWSDTDPAGTSEVIAVATAMRKYGYIRITQPPDRFSGDLAALVRNAVAMLALILENRYNAQLLNDEKLLLTEAVAEKTASLQKSHEKFLMLEKKLAQAQKMESIGMLAGGIAHDFNNILFPIVGISELMLEELSPGSPEHENIAEILKAGRRGRHLVNQILSFSRQTVQEMIPLSIQPIVKEVITLCRATIPAHIAVTRYVQPECPMVMADPTRIHQVLMNLITNAFHALEDTGGTIHVRLEESASSPGNPPGIDLPPGRAVLLSVSDTGCGMAPEIVEKIFDPYFTTKENGKGTGLGLSVVHGIVRAHKGDIHVQTEPGKGTTFFVYLPAVEPSVRTCPVVENGDLPTGDEHILVVDDEKPIVMLETRILEYLGYRTTGFSDSRKALAAFQSDPEDFDLVITDMAMPHMTGAKLAGSMIAVRPDIPIIICTGYSDRINEKTARDIGIRHFMEKPVEMSELARAVRNTLDRVTQWACLRK